MVTIEEDLEMLAKAMEMGIDPFPPPNQNDLGQDMLLPHF